DRLQQRLGGAGFQVVALSIDHGGVPSVERFFYEIGVRALPIYVDAAADSLGKLRIVGVPTTLLIDRDGRELGRMAGAAEWDSPEVVSFIRHQLAATGRS